MCHQVIPNDTWWHNSNEYNEYMWQRINLVPTGLHIAIHQNSWATIVLQSVPIVSTTLWVFSPNFGPPNNWCHQVFPAIPGLFHVCSPSSRLQTNPFLQTVTPPAANRFLQGFHGQVGHGGVLLQQQLGHRPAFPQLMAQGLKQGPPHGRCCWWWKFEARSELFWTDRSKKHETYKNHYISCSFDMNLIQFISFEKRIIKKNTVNIPLKSWCFEWCLGSTTSVS